MKAVIAAVIGGMKAGVTIPIPFTGLASAQVISATTAIPAKQ